MAALIAPLALLAALLLGGADGATSEPCPGFAHETLTLAPPTVYADDAVIDTPSWLAVLDRLENDREDGFAAALADATGTRGAVFRIARTFTPAPTVEGAIRARARERTRTCGASAPSRPLRPGRYAFVFPLHDRELVDAELLVAPGRDFVELRARAAGRAVRAVYPVTCARFDGDPAGLCAPTEASARDLDALAEGDPGAPPTARSRSSPRSSQGTERRLQTHVRVSWSLAAVGVGGVVAGALLRPRDCCNDGLGYLIVLPISAALMVGATISGAVYTHRLREHRRGAEARVAVSPGGLGFRF